jgi:hypothetical protein
MGQVIYLYKKKKTKVDMLRSLPTEVIGQMKLIVLIALVLALRDLPQLLN